MLPGWVRQYIGIPFVARGRDPAIGLDCWGLVKLVLERHYGARGLPDYADCYDTTRDPAVVEFFEEQMHSRGWRQVSVAQPGDVVVLRIFGKPRHVGVMVARNVMLSIDRGTDSCLECLDSPRWTGRIDGYYRHA